MFKVVLSSWVPHQLSERNRKERVECYQALIMLYQTYEFVFLASHLLVQDESWLYWDSSERREVWVYPHGKRSITPKVRQTNRKTMILMGFTCKPKRVSISALPKRTTAPYCRQYQAVFGPKEGGPNQTEPLQSRPEPL